MTPTSRMFDLPTLRYHALEWDAESDHTVILVHGFLDLAWGWQPVVDAGLAGRFHVVAPDMRGHGDSGRVGDGGYYYFMDYLADLHHLIARVGRARVSLVGHSMGGSVCAYYAASFPPISRLAVLEGLGPPETDLAMPRRIQTWLASVQRARDTGPRMYDSIDEAARRLMKHDPLLDSAMALTLAEHGTRAGEGGKVCFKHDPLHVTMGPYPYQVALAASFWQAITCPVLFVEGTESAFRHRAEETARRLGYFTSAERLETALIEGAAHMMHRHQPAALAALLAGFLDS